LRSRTASHAEHLKMHDKRMDLHLRGDSNLQREYAQCYRELRQPMTRASLNLSAVRRDEVSG